MLPPMKEPLPEPLPADPLPLMERWLAEAAQAVKTATAMALATVDADGNPAARMVICRGFDAKAGWLVFYTAVLMIGSVLIAEMARDRDWPRVHRAGWLVAGLALVAGLLDAVENSFLLLELANGGTDGAALVARVAATFKFLFVAVAIRMFYPEWNQYATYAAWAGLATILIYMAGQWRDVAEFYKGRGARYGTLSIVSIIVFLGILVAVNYLGTRQNRRWDLTANQVFSLSDQTIKVLQGLDAPVKMTVFDRELQLEGYKDRLDVYSYHSSKVSTDYVDPAGYFEPLLNGVNIGRTGNLNSAYFDDARVNARIAAAGRLRGEARRRAWADLDVDLMRNNPPWAPYFHTARPNFVSQSYGCFLYHPFYGVDFAAACKR